MASAACCGWVAGNDGPVTVLGVSEQHGGPSSFRRRNAARGALSLGRRYRGAAGEQRRPRSRPASEQFVLLPPDVLDLSQRRIGPSPTSSPAWPALSEVEVECSAKDVCPVLTGGAGIQDDLSPLVGRHAIGYCPVIGSEIGGRASRRRRATARAAQRAARRCG